MPTFSETTLGRLLDDAREGCRKAIHTLIQGYERWAHSMTPSLMPQWLRRKEDSTDIAQQALLAACSGLPGFTGHTEQQLQQWLVTIIERKVQDAVRRYKTCGRDVALEVSGDSENLPPADDETPSTIVRKREAGERTWSEVEKLPDRQRHVIELMYRSGLSSQEIAARLGVTAGAVRKMRARSLARLRGQLSEV